MPHHFDPTILREYDIRGIVGQTLSAADAHAIGRAYAVTLGKAGGRRVAVGYDGRLTSPKLESALVDGLRVEGADVVRIGRGPTPMLYYAAATLGVGLGSDRNDRDVDLVDLFTVGRGVGLYSRRDRIDRRGRRLFHVDAQDRIRTTRRQAPSRSGETRRKARRQ